jgi:hypothetical protein
MISPPLNHSWEGLTQSQVRNDNEEEASGTVIVAVGDSIESTIASVMYHARALATAASTGAAQPVAEIEPESDVKPQWYENWYDGLGYCEWKDYRTFGNAP